MIWLNYTFFRQEQQDFVGTVLQQFQDIGFHEIWLGGSDIGHDDVYKWADGSSINTFYWSVDPKPNTGRKIISLKLFSFDF